MAKPTRWGTLEIIYYEDENEKIKHGSAEYNLQNFGRYKLSILEIKAYSLPAELDHFDLKNVISILEVINFNTEECEEYEGYLRWL